MKQTSLSTYQVEPMSKNETAVINGGDTWDVFFGTFLIANLIIGFQEGLDAYEKAKK